jgi:hypothetical protein
VVGADGTRDAAATRAAADCFELVRMVEL